MASKLKEFHHFLHEEKLNAEAACRAKNEFLDNVGHELRTPLNAVIGFSGLLQDQTLGNLSPDQADYVEYILKEAHKLLSLINDIISYSKLEDGEGILDNVAFSLREQLSDIVSIIRKRAQKKGLTVEFFINEDVPDIVLGDEKKYRQVVWHLLSNAVKFSEKGAVEVQVEMGAPGENHSFELFTSVVDTGVGIPEDKLPFIFDVFTQVDGSNTRKYGGTGLGLAICRKLVHIMGGQITVRSEMGAGSQFNFSVRLKKVA